jgi:hypothetical protein
MIHNNWIKFPDKEDRKFRVGLADRTADREREQCSGHLRSGGLQARLNSGHTFNKQYAPLSLALITTLHFTDSRIRASQCCGEKIFNRKFFSSVYTSLTIVFFLFRHNGSFKKCSNFFILGFLFEAS